MDVQKLNKKLAEWAGFAYQEEMVSIKDEIHDASTPRLVRAWVSPIGFLQRWPPNFIQSLDACFRWLVPKLDGVGVVDGLKYGYFLGTASKNGNFYQHEAQSPALALCLAIEKLIDSEGK